MIQVEGLSKTFRDRARGPIQAVEQVSFGVRSGEIFGLLGPNGAGKTTCLRLLATLLAPSSGTARVGGYDIVTEPDQVRRQIGFLSGDMGLYHRLTGREVVTFFAKLHEWNGRRLTDRVEEVFTLLGIQEFADRKIDKLSSGMRQRIAIARTLVHDPPILILDEPTYGLDVPTARLIEEFILDAKRKGKCILFSTHVMEEAEYLCDRIAVIDGGAIRRVGTMADLRTLTGKERLREIFLDLLAAPAAPAEAKA